MRAQLPLDALEVLERRVEVVRRIERAPQGRAFVQSAQVAWPVAPQHPHRAERTTFLGRQAQVLAAQREPLGL